MTENNMKYGVVEAFSFQKGVLKVSGQWLRFPKEAEDSIRDLRTGESVGYTEQGRNLTWIEKSQQQQPQQQPARGFGQPQQSNASRFAQATRQENGPEKQDDRGGNIRRSVALKAAVDLLRDRTVKSTADVVRVACVFATYLDIADEALAVNQEEIPGLGAMQAAKQEKPVSSRSPAPAPGTTPTATKTTKEEAVEAYL